jgi:hypothetical protein
LPGLRQQRQLRDSRPWAKIAVTGATGRAAAASRSPRETADVWIVQIALRRPYTFVVFALLIAIFGILAARRTPVDIFPNINIPMVSVV